MRLDARLNKLEEAMKTNDIVVYSVWTGDDADLKREHAWQEYLKNGGFHEYDKTMFVQINKIV